MGNTLRRASIAMVAVAAMVAPLATAADAVVITPAAPRAGKLVQVGPIAENGFPAWYRDSNGTRLEGCLTLDDPLCPVAAAEVSDPDAPISFPDNFPGEHFYELNTATVTLTSGARAVISMNVEGAFANGDPAPGDQMVFGRVRIRFDAPADQKFRITHPYGVDELVSDAKRGGVNFTEDAGAVAGGFGQILNGRVGPFLKWDPAVAPAAPAGYTGNPGVDHKVVGSPYDTNFVRIEQLDPLTNAVIGQVGFTDLFSVQGRYATNAGVDLDQVTYSSDSSGKGAVDVYASSEPGQAIEVVGNPALGFPTTALRGDGAGHYYGRFPISNPAVAGTKVEVRNTSDRPVATKSRAMVDVVRVTQADYDADAQTLTVQAASSDQRGPAFTVTGFGTITGAPFSGVGAPPPTVTVTSADGGSTTVPVSAGGHAFVPAVPVAAATVGSPAIIGQTVRLDGTGSAGDISSYSWTQTAGPAVTLTGAGTAGASFVPTAAGNYTFALTVTGPGGTSVPATTTVQVVGATGPTANAGADQTVVRGRLVTLDGSASQNVESYAWSQISGPAISLTGASTAKPTFTYPNQAMPATPGPNPAFVYNNAPIVLSLKVTNPAGVDTKTVTIRPQPDAFTGLAVRYRTGNNEWRITGNTTLLAGQRVTAVLGSTLTGTVIGTPQTVDATGAFSIRVTGPAPGAVRTVSLVSSTGAVQPAFAVNVTN
jgi:hypothetical protein